MKPLSERRRRILLWIAIVLFIVFGPIIMAYATGYRLGDAMSIVRTGGIFIHSDVANTRVYIDDEFIEGNGFLLRNTLVQNLRPNKSYQVRVERDGYWWWEKTLYVQPNLVTEARLFMLPREHTWEETVATTTVETTTIATTSVRSSATTTATSTEVANPAYTELVKFFAEDRPQFAVDVATTTLVATTTIVRGRATTTMVASTSIITEIQLPEYFEKEEFTIIDFASKPMLRERGRVAVWLEQGNIYSVWVGDEQAKPFYFCIIRCKDTIVIDWIEPITRFAFFPGRDDVLLVLNEYGLHAVELDDRSRQNIQTIIEGNNLDFRVRDGTDIIVWDKDEARFLELVE